MSSVSQNTFEINFPFTVDTHNGRMNDENGRKFLTRNIPFSIGGFDDR